MSKSFKDRQRERQKKQQAIINEKWGGLLNKTLDKYTIEGFRCPHCNEKNGALVDLMKSFNPERYLVRCWNPKGNDGAGNGCEKEFIIELRVGVYTTLTESQLKEMAMAEKKQKDEEIGTHPNKGPGADSIPSESVDALPGGP